MTFYLILYISSFLIFFALWFSYGRIELTLMSFPPDAGQLGDHFRVNRGFWGLEFNIINIILSTFIFGIGDDFSIFIMDGLQNKYRTGKKVLNSHKTAIFFSRFHHSSRNGSACICQTSGLAIYFADFDPWNDGGRTGCLYDPASDFPFLHFRPCFQRITAVYRYRFDAYGDTFPAFFFGCILLRLLIIVLYPIPVRKSSKQHLVLQTDTDYLQGNPAGSYLRLKKEHINKTNERFDRPAIIIANHQSFIDILVLLSLSSKIVMVTNHWVWHSPFLRAIIRYADFYYIGEGYEQYVERMRKKVQEGYSIAIFPEGTRTTTER